MSKKIHEYLVSISKTARGIRKFTGKSMDYMPITLKFANMLEADGIVPWFDYIKGYGPCWTWMIWDNLRIVSPVDWLPATIQPWTQATGE